MNASSTLTFDDKLADLDLQDLIRYLSSVPQTTHAGTIASSSFVQQAPACTQNLPPRLIPLLSATASDGAPKQGNQS